jgi:phenylacetic acid degradation operon negative regulatory protein
MSLGLAVERHLATHPQPPVWSLIATVFGDMAVERKGALSTESLIGILGLAGVAPPAVRTALSRLVADGWLQGSREGRRSSYRMTPRAEAETAAASRRIYALPPADFSGRFDIAVITAGTAAERLAIRNRLQAEGFGQLQPDSLLRPARHGLAMPASLSGVVLLADALPRGSAGEMIAAAYDLAGVSARQRSFLESHDGLMRAAAATEARPDDALVARLLLIHGWRRLALRDPGLPLSFLPAKMRERPPAAVVAAAYATLRTRSEPALETMTGMARMIPDDRFQRSTEI